MVAGEGVIVQRGRERSLLARYGILCLRKPLSKDYGTSIMCALTWRAGLSFGDRACLALARILDLPALTTDRAWQDVDVGVTVQVIR